MEVYYGGSKIIDKKIGMPNTLKTIKKKPIKKNSKRTRKTIDY